MSAQKVFCKYLGVPLTSVCGIVYGNGEKKRLVGPFLSLGTAFRFYQGEFREGRLKESKYGQYLYNISEQLGLFNSEKHAKPQEDTFWVLAEDKDKTVWTLKPKSQIIKDYVKMENGLIAMAPPPVDALETHGGTLTLRDYINADPTHGKFQIPLMTYLQQKNKELQRRKENKSNEKRDELSLYVISFEKNKTDIESIHRIQFKNSHFQNFLATDPHQRTQSLPGGGKRIIWSSGQNINTRATRILYPDLNKEEKELYRLKGLVYVACTHKADLKLQGFLPVVKNWQPVLHKPDNMDELKEAKDAKDSPPKTPDPRRLLNNFHWEEDDSDSSSDDEDPDDDVEEPKKDRKRVFEESSSPQPVQSVQSVQLIQPVQSIQSPQPPQQPQTSSQPSQPDVPDDPVAARINIKRARRNTPVSRVV